MDISLTNAEVKTSSCAHFTRVLLLAKYEAIKASITGLMSNASCCSLTKDIRTVCLSVLTWLLLLVLSVMN